MYETLIRHINNYSTTPLSVAEQELIKSTFIPKKIAKGEYFLREGNVCKHAGFIVKGAMRQYTIDEKGKEHIVRLMIENWWASDRESYIMLTPSAYNINAWEDTDLLVITKADFISKLNKIQAIVEMTRKMDENYAIASERRLTSNLSLQAERRYIYLRKTYPEFLQRFPLYQIASYLGITKETLSRIRRYDARK